MKKSYPAKHFSPKDTLECGQVFRYIYDKKSDKYEVFSTNKHCYLSQKGDETVLECADEDFPYFEEYFDTARDYEAITEKLSVFPELADAVAYSGGLRILRQDLEETLFSFIVSANNNIKRINRNLKESYNALTQQIDKFNKLTDKIKATFYKVNDDINIIDIMLEYIHAETAAGREISYSTDGRVKIME